MCGISAPYVQVIEQPSITFDLQKVKQVADNYTVNYYAGVTLVIGHPFVDEKFKKKIIDEQKAIKDVFRQFNLEDSLVLYDPNYQVHATLIELASQHDKERTDQRLLNENELTISSKTKKSMNIDYSVDWIKKTEPFDIELGSDVLSDEHRDQTLRITETGQIVMKGRAKDRQLLAQIRATFEEKSGVVHKYGKNDDEFFFVIGYVLPDSRLLGTQFRLALEKCINSRRPHIQAALKVDRVKVIMYQNYSLDKQACLWESKEFFLNQTPDLPQKKLIDTIRQATEGRRIKAEG